MHSDTDSNYDNQSMNSATADQSISSPNGDSRIRPTRPAPAIPTSLNRNTIRRSAPQPPARSQNSTEVQQQPPQAQPRRSAPTLQRQPSLEDNTAYSVS